MLHDPNVNIWNSLQYSKFARLQPLSIGCDKTFIKSHGYMLLWYESYCATGTIKVAIYMAINHSAERFHLFEVLQPPVRYKKSIHFHIIQLNFERVYRTYIQFQKMHCLLLFFCVLLAPLQLTMAANDCLDGGNSISTVSD